MFDPFYVDAEQKRINVARGHFECLKKNRLLSNVLHDIERVLLVGRDVDDQMYHEASAGYDDLLYPIASTIIDHERASHMLLVDLAHFNACLSFLFVCPVHVEIYSIQSAERAVLQAYLHFRWGPRKRRRRQQPQQGVKC